MIRRFLSAFFCLFIFLISACENQTQKSSDTNKNIIPDLDDPASMFEKARNADPGAVDSVYHYVLTYLTDSNKFDLLEQHTAYYRTLTGNRKYAAALVAKADGLVCNFQTKYDSSNYFFDKAISLYTQLNQQRDVAECYTGKAMNYFFKGDYAGNFRYNFKALAIYEQLRDSDFIYNVKTEIADAYFSQNEFDKALATVVVCEDYFKRHNSLELLSYVKSILCKIYYRKGDYQKGLDYAQEGLAIRRKLGNKKAISGSLNNIAAAYLGLKQYDKALNGFRESLAILTELNERRQIPIVRQNIAKCLWYMGQAKEAETILLDVIDSAQRKKELRFVTNAYHLLAGLNKENKNYPVALAYYEKYKASDDSLYTDEKEKAINELVIQYETHKKEIQIAQLNGEKKADAIKKVLYLSLLFFTLISGTLVILWLGSRNKKNKLTIERVKMELEGNMRELNHFTENIISKNKLIEELEEKLLTTEKNAEQATLMAASSEQLSELYQLKILTEDDWRNFKILFDKVYPGFINKLRQQYPDLAPAEERQFLLIKLNIDNKESADMLGISTDSVKKNRYRLKKRFQLTEQDNLDDFVRAFS